MSVLVRSLPVDSGRKKGGETPSSILIQQTVIAHVLCLSGINFGSEGMGINNSLLSFFREEGKKTKLC